MKWVIFLVICLAIIAAFYYWLHQKRSRQLRYIRTYAFHRAIRDKLVSRYPHLTAEQIHMVFRGLRDYFTICNVAGRKMVAMPSQVVDDAWHEFILFTRSYRHFCRKALGRFLHHTPTEAMTTPTLAQEGIKRAWRLACAKEKIDPGTPQQLPLLFAIDALLDIPNGFKYVLDCKDPRSPSYGSGYCASHIGCGSGCAGDSGAAGSDSGGGFFDGLFDSNCGSGCGGGCGGD